MNGRTGQSAGGFTLLEALLAATILAMAVAAITVPFVSAAQNERIDRQQTLAVALAQEIMEDILAEAFEDEDPTYARNPGPDPGEETRILFDNIDDYDGYEEGPGSIIDVEGQIVDDPDAAGMSRCVAAQYVYVTGQDLSFPTDFIRVIVEVKYRQQTIARLTRLVYDTSREYPGG